LSAKKRREKAGPYAGRERSESLRMVFRYAHQRSKERRGNWPACSPTAQEDRQQEAVMKAKKEKTTPKRLAKIRRREAP